ncbi:MAG TPA: methyltransferase domain-containing protein [Rhodopila sp.]
MPESLERDAAATDPSADYGPDYYAHRCGPIPYARTDHWLRFFGGVADALIRSFAPRRVFDAGCAIGLLVESFWDRGVEAHGRDISTWAISQVRADIRPWCEVGSIADPLDAEYDLITCIEVLEHMPEAEAIKAVHVLAAAAPRILFSSTPSDLDEPTHINVRPPAYWLALWAQAGLAPNVTHDAGYLAPHAYILERSETGRSERELVAFADRVRHRVALSQVGAALHGTQERLSESERENAALRAALAEAAARGDEQRHRAETAEAALMLVRAEAASARAELEQSVTDLTAARAAMASLQASLVLARHGTLTAQANRAAVTETVTAATEARIGTASRTIRRRARQVLRVLWWAATLQLPARLRARRAVARGQVPPTATAVDGSPPSSSALLAKRFPDLAPLPVFAVPRSDGRRLTVVTDSINVGSLYGGVGTALILAALAARRMDAGLRIVTRTEPPTVANVDAVLSVHGIPWDSNIEFLHAPRNGAGTGRDVPASPDDLFLTTSWWTTWSTRQSIPRARIAYLLQEDERMFYPLGDDQLRCRETLSDPGLLYLVNSELLLAHLRDDAMAPGATAFEPSFPTRLYHPAGPGSRTAGEKRGFFFYARPNNVRNLYWRGLEALSAAIEEGILDPAEWEFHFAGHGAGPLSLPRGVHPVFPGPMSWPDYAAFVRRMEVGMSLMYTPHPSYPPLDLAASGAVVVTNRFGRKRDLDRYSPNILCADPDVPALVAALREATALAADPVARAANFARNGLQRDWAVSMAPAVERLVDWAAR